MTVLRGEIFVKVCLLSVCLFGQTCFVINNEVEISENLEIFYWDWNIWLKTWFFEIMDFRILGDS